MNRKDKPIIIYTQKKKKSNKTFLVFLGILVFVALYAPVFGSNLRYQTSSVFKYIFTNFGYLCLVLGGAGLAVTILKVFMGKVSFKGILLSGLLLWIGAFLTGVSFDIYGIVFGGGRPEIGYHALMELF